MKTEVVDKRDPVHGGQVLEAPTGVPYHMYHQPTAERKVGAAEELFAWLRAVTRAQGA